MNDNTWSTLGYSRNNSRPRLKKSEVNKLLSVLSELIKKGDNDESKD